MSTKNLVTLSRKILFVYLTVIVLFSVLYMLPISLKGEVFDYTDSLFLSASALSVTGLSSIDIAQELSVVGQIFLLIEIQFGGVGILVFVSYLFTLIGRKMTVTNLWLVNKDQNQSKSRSITFLALSVLLVTLVIEVIGFSILYILEHDVIKQAEVSAFQVFFHTISSFTNAGFTIFDGGMPAFSIDSSFIIVTTILVFIGGLGYPTIMEYATFQKRKKSLFAKINLRLHLFLFLLGIFLYLSLESGHIFKEMHFHEKLTNAMFLSANTRSGGLSLIDIGTLQASTIVLIIGLMFIGGASTSTAGGIRLTTFAVIISKLKAIIKGSQNTVLFKREVSDNTVNKSFLIFVMFIMFFFTSVFLISIFEENGLTSIAFEVMSALTNTGLSMGITEGLGVTSKIILVFLMVVGRIGVFSIIYLIFKLEKSKVKYLEEDLIVG